MCTWIEITPAGENRPVVTERLDCKRVDCVTSDNYKPPNER